MNLVVLIVNCVVELNCFEKLEKETKQTKASLVLARSEYSPVKDVKPWVDDHGTDPVCNAAGRHVQSNH